MTILDKEIFVQLLEATINVPSSAPMHMWQNHGPLSDFTLCGMNKYMVIRCWKKGFVDWQFQDDKCLDCWFAYQKWEEEEAKKVPF